MTRFSERTGWNTEESELARAHRLRREAGLPIADLTASNPTRCGFTYPASLLDALADPRALDYDPQPRGCLRRGRPCARTMRTTASRSIPEQIVLTTSTSEAYSFLFRLLCDPGSEILVPQPGYPLFDFLATLDDVRIKPAPLVYDEGWQIDSEGLRRAITPQTRAIVLVHPNNPTGHFTKPWEAEELARMCRAHSTFADCGRGVSRLWSMERGIVRDPRCSRSGDRRYKNAAEFCGGAEGVPVFVVSGLSKIAGLPQMKAAWIVATGPEKAQACERLEVIADTFLSMNAPVQWALPAWLGGRAEIQEQIRERVSGQPGRARPAACAAADLQRLEVEGGWYAVLRIPALEPDEQTVLALLERGVWVHPGYFFGMAESGWLVVSLLATEAEFRTGLVTVTNYFRNESGR